jgi:hypothetical protein
MVPDDLHRIELWPAVRMPVDVKATMATDEAGGATAAMDSEPVPNPYHWTIEMAEHLTEKVDDPPDVDIPVCGEGEVQPSVRITLATLGHAHRLVGKPHARAPPRSSASRRPVASACSLDRRPGAGLAVIPCLSFST